MRRFRRQGVRFVALAALLAGMCLGAGRVPAAQATAHVIGLAHEPPARPIDGSSCLNILGAQVCLRNGSSQPGGGGTSATAATACPNWAGTWSTDFGSMQLAVSGSSVGGNYTDNGGKLTGSVSGSSVRGTWSEQPTYTAPDHAGDFQFTLSPDGTSFSGQWRYGSSGNWSQWNGTCTNPGTVTASTGGGNSGGGSSGSGSGSGNQPAGCKQSRLLLLQGLATDTSYGPPYFADIVNSVGGRYSGVDYFSYNVNNPQNYTEQDSLQSVATSVEALHRTIGREIAACDGVTVDLIGHSGGGLVGLRYLAMYGPSTPEGAHIRHLITLDSPVNGLSGSSIASLLQAASLLGLDLSYLQSAPAVQDSIAAYNDPATPQRNINLAKSLAGKVAVLTMGSDDDLIVPFPNASIAGFSSEWALGLVSSLCPTYPDACVGHNQILHDPGVIAKISGFLGTGP